MATPCLMSWAPVWLSVQRGLELLRDSGKLRFVSGDLGRELFVLGTHIVLRRGYALRASGCFETFAQ